METETVSSRNAVDLLLREEFNAGICGPSLAASVEPEIADLSMSWFESASKWLMDKATDWSPPAKSERFVLGWDC